MKKMLLVKKKSLTGLMFCSPLILGFIMFFLIPLIQSIVFSFQKITPEPQLGGFDVEFVGWSNFVHAFRVDPAFTEYIFASIGSLLYQVPLVLLSALFFAMILNQKFKGRLFVRAIFFLPVIVASGVVFKVLLGDDVAGKVIETAADESGTIFNSTVLQTFLIRTGLPVNIVGFFVSIANGLFDLMWKTGIQTILFLAGLQTIPPSLYEASSIEGASAWENFWLVTVPIMVPIILVNTVYTVVDTFVDAANPVMALIMKYSSFLEYGRASAMAWIYNLLILLVLGAILLVFARLGNRKGGLKA